MRLVNLHVFAGGFFIVRHESGVVVLVELARHVVRAIEQRLRRSQVASGQQERCNSCLDGVEFRFHKVFPKSKKDRRNGSRLTRQ